MLPATSFDEAQAVCARLGGAISVPTDAAQNKLLQELLQQSVHDRAWLGVRDRYRGGNHAREWLRCATPEAAATPPNSATAAAGGGCQQDNGNGGEAAEAAVVSYKNWAAKQPDDSREDCVEIWTTGKWNDAPCTQAAAFFCDVVPVATATATAQVDVDAAEADEATFATFACSAHLQGRLGDVCRYVLSAWPGSQRRWH